MTGIEQWLWYPVSVTWNSRLSNTTKWSDSQSSSAKSTCRCSKRILPTTSPCRGRNRGRGRGKSNRNRNKKDAISKQPASGPVEQPMRQTPKPSGSEAQVECPPNAQTASISNSGDQESHRGSGGQSDSTSGPSVGSGIYRELLTSDRQGTCTDPVHVASLETSANLLGASSGSLTDGPPCNWRQMAVPSVPNSVVIVPSSATAPSQSTHPVGDSLPVRLPHQATVAKMCHHMLTCPKIWPLQPNHLKRSLEAASQKVQ